MKMGKMLGVMLAAILLAFLPAAMADDFTGKVVGITDGDTIAVMHNGKAEKVRLNSIDCPESGQAYGKVAKEATAELCFNQEVTVKVTGTDRYGRTLGDVILADGRSVNRELLRTGYAWWYREYSKDAELGKLEAAAKAAKIGLWADAKAIPPWEFRKRSTDTAAAAPAAAAPAAAAPAAAAPAAAPAANGSAAAGDTVVFVTRTGAKYHSDGCRYLSQSRIPMPLSEAVKRFTPCKVCTPPTLNQDGVATP